MNCNKGIFSSGLADDNPILARSLEIFFFLEKVVLRSAIDKIFLAAVLCLDHTTTGCFVTCNTLKAYYSTFEWTLIQITIEIMALGMVI